MKKVRQRSLGLWFRLTPCRPKQKLANKKVVISKSCANPGAFWRLDLRRRALQTPSRRPAAPKAAPSLFGCMTAVLVDLVAGARRMRSARSEPRSRLEEVS